ncbi:MAG: dTDP-4-dehydrorhamnose 3,5-epimerase family protein [Candidatus Buchananbacteria bacterium]
MIDGLIIKPIQKNLDDRGWLAEFFRTDEMDLNFAMGYLSLTQPKITRGPHEHKNQADYFVFIVGKFKLFLWDNRLGAKDYRVLQTYEVGDDNPCGVLVPPGVVHAYQCISETPGLVVNLPDQLYRGENKKEAVDEIRWEAMPDSPFKIQ